MVKMLAARILLNGLKLINIKLFRIINCVIEEPPGLGKEEVCLILSCCNTDLTPIHALNCGLLDTVSNKS